MEKIKIIIADDMQIIAEGIKKTILKDNRVEVIGIANDGQEEYEMIEKLQPDLVFTDNQMPKMNGIQVIEMIHDSEMPNKPQFVLITADRDMELYNRAYKNGTILVINKPIDERRIFDAIDEYIAIINDEMDEKVKEKMNEEIRESSKKIKKSFIDVIKKIFRN